MKFSFIVPMYNIAPYISRCLDSILDSDIDNNSYEIIVVNDGSTDNGLEIVQSNYIGTHSNIHIITQKNMGLSEARNTGLKAAKGDYVWFVDGDDTLDCNLSKICHYINKFPGIDIVSTRIKIIFKGESKTTWQKSIPQNTLMTGRDAMLSGFMPSSVCIYIFRREFLTSNELLFKSNITHEDVEFSYRMMPIVKSIIFTDYVSYNYIIRRDSLNTSEKYDDVLKNIGDNVDLIISFRNLSNAYRANDAELSELYAQKAQSTTLGLLVQLLRNNRKQKLRSINPVVIKRLKCENLYPLHYKSSSIFKKFIVHMLNYKILLK